MTATEQYKKNIQGLIDATNAGKIEWKKQNPTTYYFLGTTRKGERTLVSIQFLTDDYSDYSLYQLIITNSQTKETVLSINSYMDELEVLLKKLYEEVVYSIEKKGIDYFDDLIGNL